LLLSCPAALAQPTANCDVLAAAELLLLEGRTDRKLFVAQIKVNLGNKGEQNID
jgi:hypothetical protein